MSISALVFYFFEFIAAGSAVALIFVRNVFYGALLLIACLLALATIYVLAFAEFIAVTQILVYAGGILVLILFGIMLTTKISGKPLIVEHQYIFSGVTIGIAFLSLLIYFFSQELSFVTHASQQRVVANVNSIGLAIMTDFVLPFEIAGILLLIALIGAAVTASTAKSTNT